MATTDYGVNHALAVKLWGRKLMQEALKKTWVHKFIGKTADSLLQIKSETSKQAGDKITYGLRMLLSGDGVQGDNTQEGEEEALTTYSDSILINQLRHAVRSGGKMSEQRVPFSVREESRAGLEDWWADRFDTWFFNQLCGYNVQSDTRYTGNNAVVAPDSAHQVWNEASIADDQSLTSGGTMTLAAIDKCVEKAKTLSPKIRPLKVMGEDKFVMFLHPYQVYDMRTASSSGQWLDIQKAAMQGGNVSKNPIYTGSLGEYNGVVLHESTRVTQGVDTSDTSAETDVRRALFAGAQAGCLAFGQDTPGPNKMSWREELFDFGNQLGIAAGCIGGLKKTVFNSKDFSTIVCSTYAIAH